MSPSSGKYLPRESLRNPDRTGRDRASALFPGEPCEVCGMPYGGRGRVQRHHRDGDRLNNTRKNIAFLCVKHHKDAHRSLDNAVGGGARPRIAAMMRERAIESARTARVMRDNG